MTIVPALPIFYSVCLQFIVCFSVWWLIVLLVMQAVVDRTFRSNKINLVSFCGKLKLLFIPQAALLAVVGIICHTFLNILGL